MRSHDLILVALGVADVHATVRSVDIGQLKAQAFAQTQAEAIGREEEHPVAEHAGGDENPSGLFNGDDIG